MPKLVKLLLVDDDEAVLNALNDLFKDEYETILAESGQQAIKLFEEHLDIGVVILDIKMPEMDGKVTCRKLREINSDTPVIFHTGYPGEYDEETIEQEEHPFDYIQKGNSITKLQRSVKNAADAYLLKHNMIPNHSLDESFELVGKSYVMQKVYNLMQKVINSDSKVLIYGETGTGKEMVAKAIHHHSKRSQYKLAILNCNHRSPDLIESELFGHVKGSFTSAINDQIGLFEYANGGTIFLDEIGDLDMDTQTKLLRAIDSGEYSPIGVPHHRVSDVRVICATHKNLETLVAQNLFRQDLYYRLRGTIIKLPPLRERKEDIPLLIEKYTDHLTINKGLPLKIFDESAIQRLVEHDWPGNVRDLFETIESLIILTDSDLIIGADVKKMLSIQYFDTPTKNVKLSQKLKEIERTLIIEALIETHGNLAQAAQLLQTDRSNLHKKTKFYNINLDSLSN